MPNLDDELNGLIRKLTRDVDESSTVDAIWDRTAQRRRGHQVKRVGLITVAAAIAVASFVPLSSAFRKNHVVSAPSPHSSSAPVTASPFGPSPTPAPLPAFDVKGMLVLTLGGSKNPLFTAGGVSSPRRLSIPPVKYGGFTQSLSPDGTHVAMAATALSPLIDPKNDLVLVDLTTGRATRMTWLTPINVLPAWSPQGDMIAIWNWVGTTSSLHGGYFLISPNGPVIRRLSWVDLENPKVPWCDQSGISWSPDEKRLAIGRSCGPGSYGALDVIASDGSGEHQILRFPSKNSYVGTPSFSPDGKSLVFEGQDGVYMIGVDGSNLHLIAPYAHADPLVPGLQGIACPVWSPDGSVIAVGGPRGVRLLDRNGTPVGIVPGTAGKRFCPIAWYASK
jgi:WD40 repeat protein